MSKVICQGEVISKIDHIISESLSLFMFIIPPGVLQSYFLHCCINCIVFPWYTGCIESGFAQKSSTHVIFMFHIFNILMIHNRFVNCFDIEFHQNRIILSLIFHLIWIVIKWWYLYSLNALLVIYATKIVWLSGIRWTLCSTHISLRIYV